MARLRTIKPEMYTNDDLARCSLAARYLFPGLWCYADRRGILEDRPLRLKANLYPFDDVDVNALLQELHDSGFIRRYSVSGLRCIVIVKFAKHQNPHIHEKPNDLPEPPGDTEESVQPSGQHSTRTVQAPYQHSASTAPICLMNGLRNGSTPTDVGGGDESPKPTPKPLKRPHRLPEDWEPNETVGRIAREHGITGAAFTAEVTAFKNHYLANGKTMVDWQRTAMNWMARAQQFNRGSSKNGTHIPSRDNVMTGDGGWFDDSEDNPFRGKVVRAMPQ